MVAATGPSPALPYSTSLAPSSALALPASTTTVAAISSSSLSYPKTSAPVWPRFISFHTILNIFTFAFTILSCVQEREIRHRINGQLNLLFFSPHFSCSTSTTQLSQATNTLTRPTPPPGSIASMSALHAAPPTHSIASNHSSLPPPLFAAPMPPPAVSSASGTTAPHPFSAESLFQSSAKGKRTASSIQR